ncbi:MULTISPECIES: hypothetical protein [unclassified Pseudomonas]|uniref:hypothetical protein n=1 Tax=unclassified Pseudomonas TaxID=196821 RepID=UPI002AC8C051|nr:MULTISPECIES: hypothetical protein [unclassified Pseudomonas]MEB0044114.1 hypothetical protein [Pseudomonas sp. Dout3]MEB0094949.1 hypothetical protein [Pseudomonas sp. DC1.2]WPX59692.1 hypothetical protein RHM68_03315 [Pseudomonas sp. DC1.2]
MSNVLDLSPITASNKRGRPPKSFANPLFSYVGSTTRYGRYPAFALDILEGVARLDWHDRPIGTGGKSTPLSVRNIAIILECLERVTVESVGGSSSDSRAARKEIRKGHRDDYPVRDEGETLVTCP